jgi:hypothetical protein
LFYLFSFFFFFFAFQQLFGLPILRLRAYLIMAIPETCRVH